MASWVWSVVVVLCMALQVSSTNYTVVIQTDCSWFSGTEARIFLTMTGKEGRTVSAFLPNRNHFGRCATDAFIIYSNIDLKEICQITLGHDNSGFLPGWNIQSVLILSGRTLKTYNFPINRWLSRKKGDRHTIIHSTRCAPESPFFVPKKLEDEFSTGPADDKPNYIDRLLHPHIPHHHKSRQTMSSHREVSSRQEAARHSDSSASSVQDPDFDDSLAVNIPVMHDADGKERHESRILDAILAQNEYAD